MITSLTTLNKVLGITLLAPTPSYSSQNNKSHLSEKSPMSETSPPSDLKHLRLTASDSPLVETTFINSSMPNPIAQEHKLPHQQHNSNPQRPFSHSLNIILLLWYAASTIRRKKWKKDKNNNQQWWQLNNAIVMGEKLTWYIAINDLSSKNFWWNLWYNEWYHSSAVRKQRQITNNNNQQQWWWYNNILLGEGETRCHQIIKIKNKDKNIIICGITEMIS